MSFDKCPHARHIVNIRDGYVCDLIHDTYCPARLADNPEMWRNCPELEK